MRRTPALTLLALLTATLTAHAADPAPKTGTFETTFTTRSPLSEMKSLCKRLGYPAPTADYDLSKEPFFVHVPETYDPQKPAGLLVICNYKKSVSLPTPVLPQLDEANLIVVTAQNYPDESWQRGGTALDAVHNLRQQYAIDPRRIYLLGGGEGRDNSLKGYPAMAERLALNFPEVFTGCMTVTVLSYHRVMDGPTRYYNPDMASPDPAALRLAKTHPIIFMTENPDPGQKLFMKSFTDDGFQHVKVAPITRDQFHYPNYTTDWLPDFIKFLDTTTATLKLPTTHPTTTRPTTTRPTTTRPTNPK
jgi:hypothetical protein